MKRCLDSSAELELTEPQISLGSCHLSSLRIEHHSLNESQSLAAASPRIPG